MTQGRPASVVFALDRDDGRLFAFASPGEMASECKAVDVQDGYWLFFSDDGSPLEARFERAPDAAAIPTTYVLQRALSGRWLQERLDEVASVRGAGLAGVADVAEILKVNRGRRVADNKPGRDRHG